MSVRCENFLASRCAANDETRTPTVAAVKTTPVPIALYPRTVLQEDGHDERHAHEQKPLHVLRDEGEIGRAVPEQPGRQQRLLPRSLPSADVEVEPDQERDSEHEEHGEERVVGPGLEDPEDHEEHADRREDRPDRVEGSRRVGRERIDETTAEQDDRRDDRGLEDERRPPADPRRDHTSDQRPCRGADTPQPADRAEGPGTRGEIAEPQRREDVDGRDQQRRTDALEHRVPEDQHAEARGDRAQQGADPVQRQAPDEAPLAAPAVGQLAARDHQDRHDQQEQGDRGLHALDGRVQVIADVGDHHVHVRARETADELGKRERKDQPPRRHSWFVRRERLARRYRVVRHQNSVSFRGRRDHHPDRATRGMS